MGESQGVGDPPQLLSADIIATDLRPRHRRASIRLLAGQRSKDRHADNRNKRPNTHSPEERPRRGSRTVRTTQVTDPKFQPDSGLRGLPARYPAGLTYHPCSSTLGITS